MSPEEQRERHELDWVTINYHLQSLNGRDVNANDIDYIRYLDRPTAWDAAAFQTAVTRAVSRVAVTSLDNLPKH